jgi:hypothetical protein
MCPLLRKSEEKNASWKIMKEEKKIDYQCKKAFFC